MGGGRRCTATHSRSSEWPRRDFAIPTAQISGCRRARPAEGRNRNLHNYQAVGKLKPGVDLTRAQAEMRTIWRQSSRVSIRRIA